MTLRLRSDVLTRVRRVFHGAFGQDQIELRFVDPQEPAPPGRRLALHIGRQQNTWIVQAREHHPYGTGPVFEQRTLQRALVVDAAGRAALQAFTPLGEVVAADGESVTVKFRLGERLHEYRGWLGLGGLVGLQIVRQPAGDGEPVSPSVRNFLVVNTWTAEQALCTLVGSDKDYLRGLESGEARYWVRPARASRGAVTIRTVRRGTTQAQESCEVFLSDRQYSSDPAASRGVTDSNGTLRVGLASAAVHFVRVRYEDLLLELPVLPGVSPDPLVVPIPTRGRRSEFVRRMNRVWQDVSDQVHVDNQLIKELKEAREAKNIAEVRKLAASETRPRLVADEVLARIQAIERDADAAGEDISRLAEETRGYARQSIQPLQLDPFVAWATRAEKAGMIEGIVGQIRQREQEMDWTALVPLYEQLVKADPDDATAAAQLDKLKRALELKGRDHEQARQFAERDMAGLPFEQLATRWQDVDRAIRALVTAQDYLTLLKARRQLGQWTRELTPAVDQLAADIRAAGDDEDRVRQLQEKLKDYERLSTSLKDASDRVQAFLRALDLDK